MWAIVSGRLDARARTALQISVVHTRQEQRGSGLPKLDAVRYVPRRPSLVGIDDAQAAGFSGFARPERTCRTRV